MIATGKGALRRQTSGACYDTLDYVLLARELRVAGVAAPLVAAALRLQCFCAVEITVAGEHAAPLHRCTLGGLTGSRVAGAIDRCPLERAVQALMPVVGPLGWRRSDDMPPLAVAVYLDNV